MTLEKLTNRLLDTAEAGDYKKCESLYKKLLKTLPIEVDESASEPKFMYQRTCANEEVTALQKSTVAMVNYAPQPYKALKYAHKFLTQFDPPLLDELTELRILVGLMLVYRKRGNSEHSRKAIDFVKIGMERGYLTEQDGRSDEMEKACRRFRELAQTILSCDQWTFSPDSQKLVRKSEKDVWNQSFLEAHLSLTSDHPLTYIVYN